MNQHHLVDLPNFVALPTANLFVGRAKNLRDLLVGTGLFNSLINSGFSHQLWSRNSKKISIVNKITKQENEPFTVNPFQEGYKFRYPNWLLILTVSQCKSEVTVGLGQDFVSIFKSIGSLFSLIGIFHLKWYGKKALTEKLTIWGRNCKQGE